MKNYEYIIKRIEEINTIPTIYHDILVKILNQCLNLTEDEIKIMYENFKKDMSLDIVKAIVKELELILEVNNEG